MARIQQLPLSVVTKIAAGEVIERPASVIKELLENSVDAASSRIDVEVEQGGIEMMGVVDNGCGIPPDDLPLAFASHATSKLTSADDLFRIGTLGFRGEALASIGGVAQVVLQSRCPGNTSGAELSVNGGTFSPVKAWNGSAGTRIEVRHLFFNTPVRRKFLRTPATELGHISEAFTRLALSHPSIHWTLRHNGKGVYEVPASASLEERIGLFFGQEVRDHLYEVDSRQGAVHLSGFIADPACERGNPRMQYLFVNGRWVRDRSLSHALQEAYRGLLMTGRYAVCFLFLDLPPDQVDVNVHPTKAEVRFRDGHLVYHLLFGSLRDRLRAENLVPRFQMPSSLAAPQPSPTGSGNTLWATPPEALPVRYPRSPENETPLTAGGQPPVPNVPVLPNGAGSTQVTDLPPAGSFKAIQLYDSFLVLETPEGMLVIDQHALHERILFEQLTQRLRRGPLETQRLLIPQPVDLTADQVPRVLESHEALTELGLGVEHFGGNTVLVTSYPTILERSPPAQILKVIVDYLLSHDRVPHREVLLNDLLSLLACHSAVRAGDRLNPEQIAALLAQRDLANDPHHCPHGRPTALLFSRQDLERQFRRV